MSRRSLQRTGKNRAVVSKADAAALIKASTNPVLILEVVSDDYVDVDALEHRQKNPVPGFFQISSDRFEEAPLWNLRPDQKMITVLEEYGISPKSEALILLYDNIQITCGFAESRFDAAARIYSILKYFGFTKVAVIMDNAISGYFPDQFAVDHPDTVRKLATGDPKPVAPWSEDMLAEAPLAKDVFVSYETLETMIEEKPGSFRLLDARSAEEHAGTFTGYDYIPVAGRIPTSESIVNGDYQVVDNENLNSVLGRLENTLNSKEISKTDHIIWYCGTGWRAARMFALSHALGYKKVSIFDGGWNEWYQRHPL